MIMPTTVANIADGTCLEEHALDLPIACCPRSKNPRTGSTITIVYRPVGRSLEIGKLYAYLQQYKGGLKDAEGNLLVRDMEGMILRTAQDCASVVGVDVTVVAQLVLAPQQQMKLTIMASPQSQEVEHGATCP